MSKKRLQLFQNMTPERWQRIVLTITLPFITLLIGSLVINFNQSQLCNGLGVDYCAFWRAGRISNEHSLADVYNLDILEDYQKNIYPIADDNPFEIYAVMYLPVFVLPFALLALIDLPVSFIIWSLINAIALVIYLRFFIKSISQQPLPLRLLLMSLISLPVLQNFYYGQVNLWLLICAGEFLRALFDEKHIKAGAWLSGWLIKPQLLILILPFLLIRRKFKVLTGFALSAAAIGLVSFALIGVEGFQNLKNLYFDAAEGGLASHPNAMMNWRMLGWHVQSLTSSTAIGWGIIMTGSLLTLFAALILLNKKQYQRSQHLAVALLGVFAASCAVAWHAHIHTAMILIPPMLYLLTQKHFTQHLFSLWVFLPLLVQFSYYILGALVVTGNLTDTAYFYVRFTDGFRLFILNLILVWWAILANEEKVK